MQKAEMKANNAPKKKLERKEHPDLRIWPCYLPSGSMQYI